MAEANPFEPPRTGPAPAARRPTIGRGLVAWLACFGANLIVPLLFGLPLLNPSGLRGVALAVPVLGLAGLALMAARPRLVAPMVAGAAAVAASQVLPILQVMAGLVAVALTGQDSFVGSNKNMPGAKRIDFEGALLITALTGVQLRAASLAVGLVLVAVARARSGRGRAEPGGIQNAS